MKQIVVDCEQPLSEFMDRHCHAHGAFIAGKGIALVDVRESRAEIEAGLWFEGFNGVNLNVHIAIAPGVRLTREFLWFGCYYAFEQCCVRRLTGWVEESNHAARRFDEHFGFKLETRLKDAAPQGDMLIYVLWKEDCHWLNIRRPQRRVTTQGAQYGQSFDSAYS